jgi:outer membrane protein assembly factor BamB
VVIDLGYVQDAPEVTGVPFGRVGRWWRRFGPGKRRHTGYAAALVALVVATGAGSAVPVVRLVPVFDVPLGSSGVFAMGEENLYVAETGVPAVARLSGYRLSDGHPLWTVPLGIGDPSDDWYRAVSYPDLLVVDAGPQESVLADTAAYDPANGRELWRHSGRIVGRVGPDRALLVTALPGPCPAGDCDGVQNFDQTPQELALVDVRTGATAWTLRMSGVRYAGVAFDWSGYPVLRRMAEIDEDGRLVVHDLATGAATGTLDLHATNPALYSVVLTDDLLLLRTLAPQQSETGEARLTAYDTGTLARRWSVPVDTDGFMAQCGPVLCGSGQGGTTALDPADGRVLWRLPNRAIGPEFSPGLLLAYPLIAPLSDQGSAWVVDARTGRPLHELRSWQTIGEWQPPRTGDPLMMRWYGPSSRAWFGVLHKARGEVEPLGTLTGLWQTCLATPPDRRPGHLACSTTRDRVAVWRFNG